MSYFRSPIAAIGAGKLPQDDEPGAHDQPKGFLHSARRKIMAKLGRVSGEKFVIGPRGERGLVTFGQIGVRKEFDCPLDF